MSRLVAILGHRAFGAGRDFVFVFVTTAAVFLLSDGYPGLEAFVLGLLNATLVLGWGLAADVYDVSHPRVIAPPVGRLVRALIWVLLTYLAVHFFTQGEPERRTIIFATTAAFGAISLGYALRGIALVWFQRRGMLRERLLIIGGGDQAELVASQIAREPRLAIQLVGALDEFSPRSSRLGPIAILGDPLDLEAVVARTRATSVVVVANAISWEAQEHVMQIAAERPSLRVFMVAGVSDLLSSEVLAARDGLPSLVRLRPAQLRRSDAIVKRCIDLVAALLMLPGLVLLLAAALVMGGRPLTRRVEVYGRGGRRVWMRLLDPGMGHGLRASLAAGRAGKLPALGAVLKGELSMVGPRPLRADMSLGRDLPVRRLLLMAPGLTGPWDDDAGEADGLLADLSYIRTYTLWSDVRLLIASLRRVMLRAHAVPAMRESGVSGRQPLDGRLP